MTGVSSVRINAKSSCFSLAGQSGASFNLHDNSNVKLRTWNEADEENNRDIGKSLYSTTYKSTINKSIKY